MTTKPLSSDPSLLTQPARAQQLALLAPETVAGAQSTTSAARSLRLPGEGIDERRSASQLTLVRAEGLPPQLRLDSRTRTIGRAGIAELRRILADAGTGAASNAA